MGCGSAFASADFAAAAGRGGEGGGGAPIVTGLTGLADRGADWPAVGAGAGPAGRKGAFNGGGLRPAGIAVGGGTGRGGGCGAAAAPGWEPAGAGCSGLTGARAGAGPVGNCGTPGAI
jgi:hypothetical protein